MENTTTVKLYNLDFDQVKTYLFATLFVAGNIILPQLCHLIPNGGHIFLPIYFFTLIASYKYGMKVGLMTAVLSPIVNSLLFGMPPAAVVRFPPAPQPLLIYSSLQGLPPKLPPKKEVMGKQKTIGKEETETLHFPIVFL